MDKKRAEQIMSAPKKVEVQYQDVPVWIEGVHGSTADVNIIGTSRTMSVSLDELEDTGRPLSAENVFGLH